jgi:hypothetical protein
MVEKGVGRREEGEREKGKGERGDFEELIGEGQGKSF